MPRLLGLGPAEGARRGASSSSSASASPQAYAGRYPHQLSGGQQQRVGVARALAADPPVMLMDEPFSAVDPVVREQLQDEFLRLQSELGKTILFVTHDIDEAVKLGDQVAVLRVGGRARPARGPRARCSADPHDDFVADFVGPRPRLPRPRASGPHPSLSPDEEPTVPLGASSEEVRRVGGGWVLVVDDDRRPVGWVEPARGARARSSATDLHRGGTVARLDGSTRAVLDAALSSPSGRGVVVDGEGRLLGHRDRGRGRGRRPPWRRAMTWILDHLDDIGPTPSSTPGWPGCRCCSGCSLALPLGWLARR